MGFEFFKKFFEQKQEDNRKFTDEEAEKIISEKINIDSISQKIRIDLPLTSREQVVKSLSRLCLELKDKAVNYDTILSDDASGRFVSLFLKKMIDKKRSEQKKPKTKIFFLPGRYIYDDDFQPSKPSRLSLDSYDPIEKFVESKKYSIKKALVSTEFISSGYTIKRIVDILEDAGVDFDIAALSLKWGPQYFDPRIGARLIYGNVDSVGRDAFYKADFLGVHKIQTIGEDKSNKPYINNKLIRKPADPELIRAARRDVETLTQELLPLWEHNT